MSPEPKIPEDGISRLKDDEPIKKEKLEITKFRLDPEKGLQRLPPEEDEEVESKGEISTVQIKKTTDQERGDKSSVEEQNSNESDSSEEEAFIELQYQMPGFGVVESTCDLISQSEDGSWLLIGINKNKKLQRRSNIFKPEMVNIEDGMAENCFGLKVIAEYENEKEAYEFSKVANIGAMFDVEALDYEFWIYLIVEET